MSKVSFSIGDTVKLIKPGDWHLKKGTVGIITDVSIGAGVIEYAFEGCAWFRHNQFELVSEATASTLNKAIKMMEDEEEYLDL